MRNRLGTVRRCAIIGDGPRGMEAPIPGPAVLRPHQTGVWAATIREVPEVTMPYDVTLIPGDGTGPEITEATRRVLEATGVEFVWHMKDAGLAVLEKTGTVLPEDVIDSIRQTKVGLKGPITTPARKGSPKTTRISSSRTASSTTCACSSCRSRSSTTC